MLKESSRIQKGEKHMKKLLSLAALIAIMALSANSFAQPTSSKSYSVSGSFGSSPTIQVFAGDDLSAYEYPSGAAITLDTSAVTTFPSTVTWPTVDAYSVLKLYVSVSPAGSGWSVVMYTTNPYDEDLANLYHSTDRSSTITWKFGTETVGDPTPAVGAVDQATTFDLMQWMQCLQSTETVADMVTAGEGIIAADGASSAAGLIDVAFVIGLSDGTTTPGTYINNINFEVYVP